MSVPLRPALSILPPPQQRLWPELVVVPPTFTLYGGTAIALRLGHRDSVDFDFFAAHDIDPRRLLAELPLLAGALVLETAPNTLTVSVDRDGPVKLSFFGVPALGRVRPIQRTEDIGLAVADPLDLGGTKVSVVQVRAEAKDYIDIDALLSSGIDLPDMLAAASAIHGPTFTPQAALKALAYFEDENLKPLSPFIKERLRRAVRSVDLDALPTLARLHPGGPSS